MHHTASSKQHIVWHDTVKRKHRYQRTQSHSHAYRLLGVTVKHERAQLCSESQFIRQSRDVAVAHIQERQ